MSSTNLHPLHTDFIKAFGYTPQNSVYGFYFNNHLTNNHVKLEIIGWEKKTSTDYNWDGLKRKPDHTCVFQYTISGSGKLNIKNDQYILKAGDAFLVTVPSEHRYYLPETSEHWEFIFVTLKGSLAMECWDFIRQKHGPVLHLDPGSTLIQLLVQIYLETSQDKIKDAYLASTKAYAFIMECYRFAQNIDRSVQWPASITQAIACINARFHEPIALEDIAEAANLSKYYLIKQFHEHLNNTPMQYLRKVRMQKAVELLQNTDRPIKDIADSVGFANDNYFNKVFRKMMGMSAGAFRKNKETMPINYLIMD